MAQGWLDGLDGGATATLLLCWSSLLALALAWLVLRGVLRSRARRRARATPFLLLEHVNLAVSDEAAAEAFYLSLGCRRDERRPKGRTLHANCGPAGVHAEETVALVSLPHTATTTAPF